ncbi:MAG: phosphopantothenoylcysteine decarboxylase, partial [Thermoproteota archaeon]
KMGVALAEEVASRGAETTLILGPGSVAPPPGVKTIRVESTEDMLNATVNELKEGKHDLVFAAGAPSDYKPKSTSLRKIKTRKEKSITLELQVTPKIITEARKANPKAFIVAFKTEHNVSNDELVSEAFEILSENTADLVAANDVGHEGVGFQTDTNELYVVDARKNVVHIPLSDKRIVARQLVDLAVKRLKG